MNIPLPEARGPLGPPYFVTVLADRARQETESLELKQGDEVEVLRTVKKTDEWFLGRIGERVGAVPTRYVRDTDRVPPSGADNKLPWHGLDPILMKFRLRDLQKLGYIDFRKPSTLAVVPLPPTSSTLDMPSQRTRTFDPYGESENPIHPIFKKLNWKDISTRDYTLIEPALRLASRYLFEPAVFPFFTGLLTNHTEITDQPVATQKYGTLYRFDPVPYVAGDTANRDLHTETCKKLIQMQDHVKWQFGYNEPHTHAETFGTTRSRGLEGPNSPGRGSDVYINDEIIQVLRGDVLASQFEKAERFDSNIARLRTHWLLATILLHEFCHAIANATTRYHRRNRQESFFGGQRLSEYGSALESVIHGGAPASTGLNSRLESDDTPGSSLACPYGTFFSNWPGADPNDITLAHLGSAAHTQVGTVAFPHLASDTHKYFTRRFWRREVGSQGLEALRGRRIVGVRLLGRKPPPSPSGDQVYVEPEPLFVETNEQELEEKGFNLSKKWDKFVDSDDTDQELTDCFFRGQI